MKRGDKHKQDAGKPMWDLLPYDVIGEIVDVMTFGAVKYSRDGWKSVPEAKDRYFAALMRHLVAWRSGEVYDTESGLRHLAHAGCCTIFLMWATKKEKK